MYERFSDRARQVIEMATWEAVSFNHEYVGTEHLLLGIAAVPQSIAGKVLFDLGVYPMQIQSELHKILQPDPPRVLIDDKLPMTPRANTVLELAVQTSRELSDRHVGTEHLLIALAREQEGVAHQVLFNFGATREKILAEVLRIVGRHEPTEFYVLVYSPPAADDGRQLSTPSVWTAVEMGIGTLAEVQALKREKIEENPDYNQGTWFTATVGKWSRI